MEAKKELMKEFKPIETATAPGAKIISKPFEDYKSYKKYYKAQAIYNTAFVRPQLVVMKSYQTEIAIYNRNNGFLILNMDYYNSSKTTKEQLEHFKFKYTAYKQGIIYLECAAFQDLINIFYAGDVGLYENKEYNIIKRYKAQKSLIDTIQCKYLTADQKIQDILPISEVTTETKELKTRFKHIEHCNTYGVKFQIVKTWKGNPQNCKYTEKEHIKTEIKITSETTLYKDHRTMQDKKLYDGWDMGVKNSKEEFL